MITVFESVWHLAYTSRERGFSLTTFSAYSSQSQLRRTTKPAGNSLIISLASVNSDTITYGLNG